MRINKIYQFFLLFVALCVLNACQQTARDHSSFEDYEIAKMWCDMTLYISKNTPANSPTYASRCVGYIGLTMYESVVHGNDEMISVASQLNGLEGLPVPSENTEYNWKSSFNAGQAMILKSLYNQTSDENKLKIDSLEQMINKNLRKSGTEIVSARSEAFGKKIAEIVFEWSKEDGGHRAYLNNFDKDWVHPEFPGSWKPPLFAQSFSHHPLHPKWGENRTFVPINQKLAIPKYLEYNTSPESEYYQAFMEVYKKDAELTQEDKEVALWWGDDPDDTFTPPGHSFFIAGKVVDQKKLDIYESAETFAHVGMAVADAFINCWKWKYHHFTERANTFIPANIDQSWESFWPDPPFPAFPSGHAIQAAAAAKSLMNLHGNEFSFVDDSHVGRERDEVRDVDFKARSFNTFWDAAVETANSRFFGGIHIKKDNDVGLEEGRRIADNVSALEWKK